MLPEKNVVAAQRISGLKVLIHVLLSFLSTRFNLLIKDNNSIYYMPKAVKKQGLLSEVATFSVDVFLKNLYNDFKFKQ